MTKKYLLLYFLVFTIPLCLGLLVWQSNRYKNLSGELTRLEQTQTEWVESNKKLIAGICEYSSPERIDYLSKNELELHKIPPEYFLQVKIMGGTEHGY
ncbi:MAG: cell division protein FtsL [Treponema sp.]|jgi:cell division protein FtsL|nr:cell division protein FtsL [Treponema sp.]